MAGLGYKAFTGGAVLTAAQVQGYLQDQAVMKFASATARDAAITSPTEGMVCYLADSSAIFAYDGGSWCIVPVQSEYILASNYTIASPTTAAQNLLAASGSGASLGAGFTYEVEGVFKIQIGAGTNGTQPNFQLTYSGTAASSSLVFNAGTNTAGFASAATASLAGSTVGVPTASLGGGAAGGNYWTVYLKGIVKTTTAGTLTPQMTLSTVTTIGTITVQANSWWKVTPIGSSTLTTAGTWV